MNSLSGPLSNIPGKLEFGNVGFEGWGKTFQCKERTNSSTHLWHGREDLNSGQNQWEETALNAH